MKYFILPLLSFLFLLAQPLFTLGFTLNADAQQLRRISIVFPLMAAKLSSSFGPRFHPIRKFSANHRGVDLAAPEDSHVRAVLGGRVVFAGRYKGYGKLVTIDHGGGKVSLYGHLSEIKIKVGEKVKSGTLIGRVGSTGMSTAPHLHFEWRHNGRALDPLTVFPSLLELADG